MAGTVDLWNAEDTFAIVGWAVAFVTTARWWATKGMTALWRARCKAHEKTIARLRAANANRRAAARALPAAPQRPPVAPRTRFRWIWPGTNTGRLPVAYGLQPEALRLDPCLTPQPMSEADLHAWLAEDEPFLCTTREQLLVEVLCTHIEHANPPVWVVPNLPEVPA